MQQACCSKITAMAFPHVSLLVTSCTTVMLSAWSLVPIHHAAAQDAGQRLNDVHSQLNPVTVAEVIRPTSMDDVIQAIHRARRENKVISIAGSRHSMGGQQFASGALHLDMTGMNEVLALDKETGRMRAQAGISWLKLFKELARLQANDKSPWAITQKQTGADDLTLGGAVSTNIHGRGLKWQPFVQDIVSLTIANAEGDIQHVSREENADLFALVIGGYGLFGVILEVELQLQPQQKLERIVEVTELAGLTERIAQRIKEGYTLGDFQFCPDDDSSGFMKEGVFACYRPVDDSAAIPADKATLKPELWRSLIIQAHADKQQAWQQYVTYYKKTHGQLYYSDEAQFGYYDVDYVEAIQKALPKLAKGSLMISELYVPVENLEDFMAASASDFKAHGTEVIYGTIRFIRKDDTSFLPWARRDYACIVFNLRVTHSEAGIMKARQAFRLLIDRALERDGSFFLTYHRWATKEQMLKAYPQFPEFLKMKKRHDSHEVFQSEWYRHWRGVFASGTAITSP